MDIRQKIKEFLTIKKRASSTEIARHFGFTRQYASQVLRIMANAGEIVKFGSTRAAFYTLPKFIDEIGPSAVRLRLKNEGVKEHEVFDRLTSTFPAFRTSPENVQSIVHYAFSEMLNNAIDHSGSDEIIVEFVKQGGLIKFIVNDFGIGIFNNVMKKRGLKNEHEAIQDLLKGKQTTAREFHSGEGIFFTSKIADKFSLISERTELIIDNNIGDFFIKKHRRKHGTTVLFEIKINAAKKLTDVFKHFAPVDEGFNKTEIKVRLYTLDTSFISRSQARRLLAGLNDFKEIVLDFEKVETIGQGFADEIFRVWQAAHPQKAIKYINANENVEFMIKRVF